jgi:hypothetical protein
MVFWNVVYFDRGLFSIALLLIISGGVIFGVAGKISFDKVRDKKTGIRHAKWKHSCLADIIAVVGVLISVLGVAIFLSIYGLCSIF